MEALVLLALLMVLVVVGGSIAGIVALVRISALHSRLEKLQRTVVQLRNQLNRLHGDVHAPRERERGPAEPRLETGEKAGEPEAPAREEAEQAPAGPSEASPGPGEEGPPSPAPISRYEERGAVPFRFPEPVRARQDALPEPEPVETGPAGEELPVGEPEAPESPASAPAVAAPGASPLAPPSRAQRDAEWWTNLEQAIGQRWITWAGAVVLIIASGFFVKYAFDHRWLGPAGRVILGVVAGLASAAAGEVCLRRRMNALGQGLLGLGMAVLYVSLYATYGIYRLLPQEAVFAFMVLVTAGGMAVAVARDAVALSFLAVLGGLLTPLLLQSGEDPRDYLFGYLVILDLGVLAVALFKRWRILEILAFAGSWAYVVGWYHVHYAPESMVPATIWVALFTAVFLTLPNLFHLRNRTPLLGERFVMAVVNAGLSMGMAFTMLYESSKAALGIWALALSAAYLALGSLVRRRIEGDARAVFALVALSLFFVVASVPIFFDLHAVTILWALQAPVLLYLAFKYDYLPARLGAAVPFLLAVGRVFTVHWPLHGDPPPPDFTPLLNRDFGSVLLVVLSGAAFALVHAVHGRAARGPDRAVKILAGLASAFLLLILGHVELSDALLRAGAGSHVSWASSLVWTAGAGSLLAAGWFLRSLHGRIAGFVALAVTLALVVQAYGRGYGGEALLLLNGRFLAGLVGVGTLLAYALAYRRGEDRIHPTERACPELLVGGAVFLLVLLASFESWQWLAGRGHFAAGRSVLPPVWALGAALYLIAGLRMESRFLRGAGIGALFVAACLSAGAYAYRAEEDHALFANAYFVSAVAVLAALFAYGGVLFARRGRLKEEEEKLGELLVGCGLALAAVLTSAELWIRLDADGNLFLARSLLPHLWALTVCLYLAAGRVLSSNHLRVAGLVPLMAAILLGVAGYFYARPEGLTIFLNGRFLAALSAVAAIFVFDRVIRRLGTRTPVVSADDLKALFWVGIVSLQVLVSAEAWEHYRTTIPDPERAAWTSQMALSVVWALFASGLLVLGFVWRNRPLRFFALAQFGVTALKVVIVDMSRLAEGFRIVSFLVLGVLMIGASYLYHKVEKRLQTDGTKEEGPS